jgi:hypothetical protein
VSNPAGTPNRGRDCRARPYQAIVYASRFGATIEAWAVSDTTRIAPVGNMVPLAPDVPDLVPAIAISVDPSLIGRRVELRLHPEDRTHLDVFSERDRLARRSPGRG